MKAMALAAALAVWARPPAPGPELAEVRLIWGRAPHNAFPDLTQGALVLRLS